MMAISKFLDPKNDVAFKRIFGSESNQDVLVAFINDIMNYQDKERVDGVTFLSPVQDPEIAYKKQSIVDVLCRTKEGTQIIIEMQVSPQEGFEKRAQYYAAKAYSRQLTKGKGEEGRYVNLKKVIFIAISDYIVFPNKKDYISHHVVLDKKTYDHDLQDFSFSFIELPKFTKEEIATLSTLTEKWCYFFKYADQTSEAEVKALAGGDLAIERAYEALNQFNWTESELLAYEQEIKRIMDNRAVEDYKVGQIQAKVQQALSIGIEQGREQGKAEGRKEAIESTASMMLKEKIRAHVVAQVTGLSLDEIAVLKAKLN